uniref:Uncharacterized protein n=1 Tax=Arundo donax TaxID=35708 RepID=A0A0A9HIW2_ARUDO
MPDPLVQLEKLGARNPEDEDISRIGRQVVVPGVGPHGLRPLLTTLLGRPIHDRRLGYPDVPVLAADGAEALCHAGVVGWVMVENLSGRFSNLMM